MDTLTRDLEGARCCGPADAAARVLDRFFGRPTESFDAIRSPLRLARFQAEAVGRILRLLDTRGGALLADSVGLGKTHIALAVIERWMTAGRGPVLVLSPAALRRQWVRPLRQLARPGPGGLGLPGRDRTTMTRPALEWSSHARLARGALSHCRPRLVVVDEAHAFRNPRTRRYREMARICHGARALLITATPINNSLSDLYFQLRLFLGEGDLADLGIPDLRALLRPGAGSPALELRTLRSGIAALAVRRSRRVLESEASGMGLRFPRRGPPVAVLYDLDSGLGADGLASLLHEIECLRLATYGFGAGPGHRAAVQLVRVGLLKRLESSPVALDATLLRLDAFLHECSRAIPSGKLPVRGDPASADPDQLVLGPLIHRDLPQGSDLEHLASSVSEDLERVRRIRTLLSRARTADPKVAVLGRLLRGPLAGRSTLIFTEFRDTAMHLHRALSPHHRAGLVTGREARLGNGATPRRTVIDAFAPVSNGVDVTPESRVDVLIATDVLAEGLNLQDCGDVVSFDLPWNPVRLVQRIGRIDRLGSLHDRIRIYNFMPDRGLDSVLGLLERIRSKLDSIRAAGNFDVPDLDGSDPDGIGLRTTLRRLRNADAALLAEVESEADSGFELEERVHALARQGPGCSRPGSPCGPPDEAAAPEGSRPVAVPVFASVARPVGEAGGWLVTISDRGLPRFLFVRDGQVREDRTAALGILVDAASAAGAGPDIPTSTRSTGVPAPGSETGAGALDAVANAARYLFRAQAPPARGADPAGRIAGLLLRRLRLVPGGANAEECRRADAILERLRPGVRWGAAAALATVLDEERNRSTGTGTCTALMARLESLLSPWDPLAASWDPSGAPPAAPEGFRLVALFRLLPARDLVLEHRP